MWENTDVAVVGCRLGKINPLLKLLLYLLEVGSFEPGNIFEVLPGTR
jgi:hypothetical protein